MEQKYIIMIVVAIVLVLCCCSSLIVSITTGIIFGTTSDDSTTTGDAKITGDTKTINDTSPKDTSPEDTSPEVKVLLEPTDVSLSSLYAAGYPGGKLIDANTDTFSHTKTGDKEWIKITLKKEVPITKVIITNRKDCCQDMIVGATLTITNASGTTTHTEIITDSKPIYTILPPKGTLGNMILLQRPNSGVALNIAEMEVYTRQSQISSYPPSVNWRCVAGFDRPVTINEAGDVQCMSANGHDCVPGGGCAAHLLNPPNPVKPLVCGEMHKKEWGYTGYDNPDHWCSKTKPLL